MMVALWESHLKKKQNYLAEISFLAPDSKIPASPMNKLN